MNSPGSLSSREIRAARPRLRQREAVDPWRPLGVTREEEPEPPEGDGPPQGHGPPRPVTAATVFLAGAECPFTCAFCDLWRYTLDGPTPAGAIPAQIRAAWDRIAPGGRAPRVLKLYNASNFFEPRAVPEADDEAIVDLVHRAPRVVVENHPRLVGDRCFAFAAALAERGSRLEVAMGLETVHPEVFPRLNKGMQLADFAAAAERLTAAGIEVRAFVLVGTPWIPPAEQVHWAVTSARWAFERGARFVSLIPVRAGNGALDRLAAGGAFRPPTAAMLADALAGALAEAERYRSVAVADPWDLDRLAPAGEASGARADARASFEAERERILRMNREQVAPAAVAGSSVGRW